MLRTNSQRADAGARADQPCDELYIMYVSSAEENHSKSERDEMISSVEAKNNTHPSGEGDDSDDEYRTYFMKSNASVCGHGFYTKSGKTLLPLTGVNLVYGFHTTFGIKNTYRESTYKVLVKYIYSACTIPLS